MASTSFDVTAVLKANIGQFKSGIDQAKSSLSGLQSSTSKMGSMFKSVLGANLVGAGVSKGLSLIKDNLGSAIDRFDTLNKYPKVMNALGYSTQDVAKSTKILSDGIDGLPTTLDGITSIAQQLAPMTGSATKASQSAIALNNAFLASGASTGDASRGLQQYSQMLSTGKVDMMAWRTLQETMPIALQKTAEAFGFTGRSAKNDLYAALKSGSITMDQLNDKFIELNGAQGGFADLAKKNSQGIRTSFTNLKNAISKNMANIITDIDKGFSSSGLGSIASVLDGLKGKINSTFAAFGPVVSKATTQVISFFQKFSNTGVFSALGTAIKAIIAAFKNMAVAISGGKGDWTNLGTTIGNFVKKIEQAATSVANFIAKMNPSRLRSWGLTIAALVMSFKAFNFLKGENPITTFLNKITGGMTKTKSSSSTFANRIKAVFSGIGSVIKSLGTSISTVLQGLGTAISTVATGIGTGLATAFQGLGAAIAMVPPTTFLALGAAILMIGAAFALAGTQASGISQIFQTVGNVIVQILQQMTTSLATLIPIVTTALATLIPMITAGISQIVASVTSGIATLISAIAGGISQIVMSIATGVSMIISSLTGLLGGISGVITSIAVVIQSIAMVISAVFTGIATVITAIGAAIKASLDGLANAFTAAGNAIKTALDGVANVITSFGNSVKTILDGVKGVITGFGDAVRTVLDGIANVFTSMGTAALNAGIGVRMAAQGISMLVALPLGDLGATLALVGKGLTTISGLGGGLTAAGAGVMQLATGMLMFSTAAMMVISPLSMIPQLLTTFAASVTAIPASVTTATTSMQNMVTTATTVAASIVAAGAGFTVFNSMVGSVASATIAASTGISAMGNSAASSSSSISNLTSQITTLGNITQSSMSSMESATFNSMSEMDNAISQTMNTVRNDVQNGMNRMAQAVQQGGSQMASAMRSSGSQLVNTVQSSMNRAVAAARSAAGSMQAAGAFVGQGLANGMLSALGAVTAAANQLVAQAERAAQAKAKIHSPSRLFRDEVGYYIGAGIGVGIKNSAKFVNDSLDFIQDGVNAFNLDTSNLVSALNIGNSIDNIQAEMLGSVSLSATPTSVTHTINNQTQNSLLLNEMKRNNNLLEQGKNIVMDTGALVGATSNSMNLSLGNTARLGGRLSF